MTERYFRVYDSRGTVEVAMTESRARQFRESGYPVEVWDLKSSPRRSIHDCKQQLYALDGGRGPAGLSGSNSVRVGSLEEVCN